MKVGDLVTTKSRHFLGVIIDSKTMDWTSSGGKILYKHHVYWCSPKVERNPHWVNEHDLVRAV